MACMPCPLVLRLGRSRTFFGKNVHPRQPLLQEWLPRKPADTHWRLRHDSPDLYRTRLGPATTAWGRETPRPRPNSFGEDTRLACFCEERVATLTKQPALRLRTRASILQPFSYDPLMPYLPAGSTRPFWGVAFFRSNLCVPTLAPDLSMSGPADPHDTHPYTQHWIVQTLPGGSLPAVGTCTACAIANFFVANERRQTARSLCAPPTPRSGYDYGHHIVTVIFAWPNWCWPPLCELPRARRHPA